MSFTFDSTAVTWDYTGITWDAALANIYTVTVPTDEWIDLFQCANRPAGTQIYVENVGVSDIRLATQEAKPDVTHDTYNVLQRGNGQRLTNTNGDRGIWAFCKGSPGKITIMIEGIHSGFKQETVVSNLPVINNRVPVRTAANDLGYDAWGRQKTTNDYSVWYGMFTLNVPPEMWLEYDNGVEQTTFTNFTSVDGALLCTGSAGDEHVLISKRHPRYQPNRGHLYATSMIIDTPDNGSTYEFGLFHDDAGVFFRVVNNELFAVRRTMLGGVVSETSVECITVGVDLAKGNIYDIQMQWRGVGNIKFFVNLEEVATFSILGTLDDLSIWNPALPICHRVFGVGTMRCGCVDVTSEGGNKQTRIRGFIGSDETALSTAELPVAVIYFPRTITYNGTSTLNTRDAALRRITAFADDNTILRVYYTRDISKFAGTVWTNYDSVGAVQYSTNGNITIDNFTTNIQNISTRRIAANQSIEIENPDPLYGDYYLIGGDIVVVSLQAKNATSGGSGIEWGSEI